MVGGCFADPPGGDAQGDASTSTTDPSSSTTAAVPTTMPPTTVATTDDSTSSSTTSVAGSSSSSGESGAASTSSTTGPGDSTGTEPACPGSEVLIGTLCVEPLVVTDAFTVVDPATLLPILDDPPCLRAECSESRPLGGGFVLDGLLAHASHRTADMIAWTTCTGPDPQDPSALGQGYARCTEAQGDVFVVSETYLLEGDEGTSCYDVQCPPGSTLVGGGGRWGPDFEFQGSEPDEDGSHWRVCGSGMLQPAEVEVDAYCTVLPRGAQTSVYTESVEVEGGGSSDCVEVTCPTGIAVSGGGFGVVTSVIEASHPLPGQANGWRTCGRADGIFSLTIRARALCLEP